MYEGEVRLRRFKKVVVASCTTSRDTLPLADPYDIEDSCFATLPPTTRIAINLNGSLKISLVIVCTLLYMLYILMVEYGRDRQKWRCRRCYATRPRSCDQPHAKLHDVRAKLGLWVRVTRKGGSGGWTRLHKCCCPIGVSNCKARKTSSIVTSGMQYCVC